MNPSLKLLSLLTGRTAKEVETAWRDAKHFRKTEGGKDYRLAWEHLGRLLKLPPVLDPEIRRGRKTFGLMVLEQSVHVVEVGAETMTVETTHGSSFVIPAYFLLIDSRISPHDTK